MKELATACAVFILFDIAAGIAAALKNHELSSAVMRDGLYNKLGEVMLLAIAMICGFLLTVPPLTQLGIPSEVAYSVGIYIIGMELLSVLENICKLNPELPIAKILYMFDIDPDEDSHEGVDTSEEVDVESKSASEE